MKKITAMLALTTLVSTINVATAGTDIFVEFGSVQDLKQCKRKLERVTTRKNSLKEQLQACRSSSSSNRQLIEENLRLKDQVEDQQVDLEYLESENDSLSNRVERLQRRLDDLTRPAPRPSFNLAASVKACKGISSSTYASQCAQAAKKFRIKHKVVKACTEISSSFYALECVKSAGKTSANARQVNACAKISSDTYAAQCVQAAGGKVEAAVVNSCVESSSSSFYQLQCVKDMAQ